MKTILPQIFVAILLCAFVHPGDGAAHDQDRNERKAAHAHYEKALTKKEASERLQWLQEGVRRYSFSAELHYALGREYHQRERLDSALVHFEVVLALDAELAHKTDLTSFLPQAYAALAAQSLKRGKPGEALARAQRALHFDSEHVAALNVAALAAHQMKQYEQALQYGRQLLVLQPSAQHYNNFAATCEARGDLTSAEQNYQKAIALDPDLTEARSNLQRVQNRQMQETTKAPQAAPAQKTSTKEKKPERTIPVKSKKSEVKTKPTGKPSPTLKREPPPKIPLSRFKVGAPRTNRSARTDTQLAAIPKSSLPMQETRTSKGFGWSTTIWTIAICAFVILVWKNTRHRNLLEVIRRAVHHLTTHQVEKKIKTAPSPNKSSEKLHTESTRMLRRIEGEAQPAATESAVSEPVFGGAAPTPLFSPERVRAVLPAQASSVQPASPQIGLQTEMLFAEMIAATPMDFDGTSVLNAPQPPHGNGFHNVEDQHDEGVSKTNHKQEVPDVTPHTHALADSPSDDEHNDAYAQKTRQAPRENRIEAETPSHTDSPSLTSTMDVPALAVQRIGRYVIEKELAAGTTGKIYKAWDPKLDRIVVLKTVLYGLSASSAEIAALKDRIYREARAIAKLNHPNIVIVYDVDDQPEFSYLVMEYLEGRDLKQVLEGEHRLDCKRALQIVAQICDAMEYAHRAGVFHRDVKPSNIMLLDNDEVKVTDFGIAKISNYLSLTQTGRVLGTPSYMAPEQIEGQDTDGRADLFSLGIMLYELLVGKRPFVADSLAALAYKIVHKTHIPVSLENVELPMALDDVVNRLLAKRPDERYRTATQLRKALTEIMAQLE